MKRLDSETSGSRHTLKIEVENSRADLSCPIAEPTTKVEEVELYAGYSGKMVCIEKNM